MCFKFKTKNTFIFKIMQTILIHETHPDPNYNLPISSLFKDYGQNPNHTVIFNLEE